MCIILCGKVSYIYFSCVVRYLYILRCGNISNIYFLLCGKVSILYILLCGKVSTLYILLCGKVSILYILQGGKVNGIPGSIERKESKEEMISTDIEKESLFFFFFFLLSHLKFKQILKLDFFLPNCSANCFFLLSSQYQRRAYIIAVYKYVLAISCNPFVHLHHMLSLLGLYIFIYF